MAEADVEEAECTAVRSVADSEVDSEVDTEVNSEVDFEVDSEAVMAMRIAEEGAVTEAEAEAVVAGRLRRNKK
jgi:hypothetical protein